MKLGLKLILFSSVLMILFNSVGCNQPGPHAALEDAASNAEQEKVPESKWQEKSNNPELVQPQPEGTLRLTAQNGKAIGPDIKYMPEWGAFGWFTAKDRVEWEVDVKESGKYTVQLEWSVSDKEAGKEFLLEANDQKLTGIVRPSGSWEIFKIADIGSIYLEAGVQHIVFKSNKHFDEGAILDLRELKLTFVK